MSQPTERTLFLDAIELTDRIARGRFLDEACGGNQPLRNAVDRLLQAHETDEHPLDKSPVAKSSSPLQDSANTTAIHLGKPSIDPLDRMIDSYRLMEQIGEGGFGVVYVAQQERPVRRKVALKMVKPGMGSKEVIARFEAERQALALMDHPCIARVFDAGVSDDQRPYFVMELVRGVPITEFCDKARLNIRQRLELFVDVCSAVHHAHQKGVIHRDLKPSNVLTTLYDDRPVVKVIDFGIAKAIGQSLTDKTIYTRFMSMMGTPLYMSPEQAEMNTLDVDTRSDIYSLGVMLYELLTGTTPIDSSRIDAAGYNEIRRIILEEEPPIPSNRISTLGNRISTISGMRQIEPNRFTSSIRGDLDWIVMKAMDKDRTRRYDSAASMARDIQCYLRSEPVEARPPSQLYRLSKFARRNRAVLVSVGLIATSLVAGTALSVYQMSNAVSALREKEEALREALLAKGEANAARNEIAQFSDRIVQSNVLVSRGQTHANARRWQAAIDDFAQALSLQPSFYLPWVQRGQLYSQLHLWQESASDFDKAMMLGAPTDQPQWTGTGALFSLADQTDSFETLVQQERKRFEPSASDFSWQALRNCVVSKTKLDNLDWPSVAANAESRIDSHGPAFEEARADKGMNRRIGEAGRSGPGRSDRESMEGRRGGRGFGGPFGDGGRNGPGPNARRGGSLPLGAQRYVSAIAYLRAGDNEKTLDLLEKAELDRGWIGSDLIHNVRAIALHNAGEESLARQSLDLSHQALERWVHAQLAESKEPSSTLPWFDLVEGIVLHREATKKITGKASTSDEILGQLRDHAIATISEGM